MKQNYIAAENVQFKKHLINFSVILIILLTAFFIVSSFLQKAMYYNLSSDNAIFLKDSQITGDGRDFSYYFKKSGDDIRQEYTAEIKKADIDKINERYLTIFTPKMQCEAFELYLNGKSVAVEGDIKNYNSNIWTHHYCYTVDSSFFDLETNEFKIVQYSRYMGGGLALPFMIDGYQASIALRNCHAFDTHLAVYGIAFFMLILLVLVVSLFAEKRKNYIYMLATLIFLIAGYLEYFDINVLGIDYLPFKKFIVSCSLLSVGFGTVFYRRVFNKKKNSALFLLCYSALILIPTFFAGDMPTYKIIYTALSFIIVPLLLYWGYLAIRYYRKYVYSRLMLTLSAACVLYTLVWTILELTKTVYMDSITLVILPAYIITVFALILIDFHELKINVEASNKRFKKAYRKSIIDGLTGLYNAEYIKEIASGSTPPFAFVVFDIDDFKTVNDTYGHPAGDEVLMTVSKEVSQMLRNGDMLGRYGGDEFILVLKANSEEAVKAILERIRKRIEAIQTSCEGHSIKVTISLGFHMSLEKDSYEEMLAKADKALYYAKYHGKNKLVYFGDISEKINTQDI